MGHKSCFICCLPTKDSLNSVNSQGLTEKKEVDNQLQVVFLLRKLLEIPEDTCCKLLQHFGNPNLWIECCNSCSMLVEKSQSILCQIASLEKYYDELRMDIKYKILKSQKDFNYNDQCETIVRSQIISKDIDYFIKTTALEKCEDTTASFPNSENMVEITGGSPNPCEEIHSYREYGQHLISNTVDPLTDDADKINSGTQSTAWDADENEEVPNYEETIANENHYSHQEQGGGEIDIKPYLLVQEEVNEEEIPLVDSKQHLQTIRKRSNFQNHKRKPKPAKKLQCSICGKDVISSKLQLHIMTVHNNVRPFKCDLCGQRFRQKYHLSRHVIGHTLVKEFQCDMCGQRFGRNDVLRVHQKIHISDREYPFKCVMCGKSLLDTENLKEHYRQHTEEKDQFFKCLICGGSSKTLKGLQLHIVTHSEEQIHQ